ncbi:MAG: glycosyl transferase family 1 [Firmicutes bacterium HGW-Firmicutes-1]|jgi:glycosyltransferase involved in cell wall biosynthesis|nr:MAG: glycosyl transferase family 1 [Firmicutes bacterium HGW-Firmicutes-1]
MKVVHVNTFDAQGGASIAALRLHDALMRNNVESYMLVQDKIGDHANVTRAVENKLDRFFFSKLRTAREQLQRSKYKKRENIPYSTGGFGLDISKHPLIKEADIINLHWINMGFVSLKTLRKLSKLNKKIIWTLHDSWPFTGGCHVRYECDKYIDKCGNCPTLKSNKNTDLSRRIWSKKQKIFKISDISWVAPSIWLAGCAKNSSLLSNMDIEVIPNTLDVDIFKPIDKLLCREILNIDPEKYIICFGAVNGTDAKYKGFKYLEEAISILVNSYPELRNKLEILVFGASNGNYSSDLKGVIRFMGRLHDNYTLAIVYNAANVFVGPSLEESFGQTFSESMACGTCAVAFNQKGPVDIIDHKENGYLAKFLDSDDLANGIYWCLTNNNNNVLGMNARKKVIREYSYDVIAKKYIELYKVISNG